MVHKYKDKFVFNMLFVVLKIEFHPTNIYDITYNIITYTSLIKSYYKTKMRLILYIIHGNPS